MNGQETIFFVLLCCASSIPVGVLTWLLFRRYLFHKKFSGQADVALIVLAFGLVIFILGGCWWGLFDSRRDRLRGESFQADAQAQHPDIEIISFSLGDRYVDYYQGKQVCTAVVRKLDDTYYFLRPDCALRKSP